MTKQLQFNTSTHGTPLAERMRPQVLDEVVGHGNVIGPEAPLGKILRSKNALIPSMLFWGPPGTGKTTLAKVIADGSGYHFVRLSGVLDGVKELREVVVQAEREVESSGRKTLALVDEIHRFNKSQQDAFLPHVESGILTVIGMTTDNVSFRLRSALLSRMRVVPLSLLTGEDVLILIDRAIKDPERGLGIYNFEIDPAARNYIASLSGGDGRRALNALEWTAMYVHYDGRTLVTEKDVKDSFGTQPKPFDQSGDYHYDCISAFIKSMRGSDPDAALYYMLRALESGEDPLFLSRRMIIFASEDASCDPRALQIAIHADQALERVGLPEGTIPMAQAACYLASCPKSNATYTALRKMEKIVAEHQGVEIPRHLRNAPTELMKEMGNAAGYKYPHDYPDAFVPERYLPQELGDLIVYEPGTQGIDPQIGERLKRLRSKIQSEKRK
jgi:putative ATPase